MNHPFPFSVITGRVAHQLIHGDLHGCLEVIRAAYAAHDQHQTINPQSVFLRFPDRPNARIIGLPAHVASPKSIAVARCATAFSAPSSMWRYRRSVGNVLYTASRMSSCRRGSGSLQVIAAVVCRLRTSTMPSRTPDAATARERVGLLGCNKFATLP